MTAVKTIPTVEMLEAMREDYPEHAPELTEAIQAIETLAKVRAYVAERQTYKGSFCEDDAGFAEAVERAVEPKP